MEEEAREDCRSSAERNQKPTNSTPTKNRSLSDPPTGKLAPSPSFAERAWTSSGSKDDSEIAIPSTPKSRPKRPGLLHRGLSLQLVGSLGPAGLGESGERAVQAVDTGMLSPSARGSELSSQLSRPAAAPLSPQLDSHNIYMQASPVTSLPRHSRGLDFARACSTLHHSTLAESSPDSSPVITQKGMMIPRSGNVSAMMLDSPNLSMAGGWTWGGQAAAERSTVSSSVGSVNMLASDSESSDSDEDASMEDEDPIHTTPQVHKLQNPNALAPFNAPSTPGGGFGSAWPNGGAFSPAQASLMKTLRRVRLQKDGKKSRKRSTSTSGSGYSSMASPRAGSPPPLRSIENAAAWTTAARSRRESLALGAERMHLSSGNDSGDETSNGAPSTPGVVRRTVTRRSNLLPKTKGFARIKAALAEEATPVDTEVRREADTIRQVRERDNSVVDLDIYETRASTAASSPNLLPAVPESAQEDFGQELDGGGIKDVNMNFAAHASRNSGGLDYWNRFDPSLRTPPPPSFARQQSSASDMNMDNPLAEAWRRPRARSSASDASEAFAPPSSNGNGRSAAMNDDVHLKKFKRRREDDFDIATIKRRAVSPGMSTQNSPVLAHSPGQRDLIGSAAWGLPPERRESQKSGSQDGGATTPASVRTSREGSVIGNGVGLTMGTGKKLGLQGMVDTHDGLMKMSIEHINLHIPTFDLIPTSKPIPLAQEYSSWRTMASKQETVASFVESAPPGELSNVTADIKALAPNEVSNLLPAFQKYNEEQYTTVQLPGASSSVLISKYNALGANRYFDSTSQTSFEVDHAVQRASATQQHPLESSHADLIRSLQKGFAAAASEHFPSSTVGVFPTTEGEAEVAILLVANKYSPQNFWNGRWRSTYLLSPGSGAVAGKIQADVHYYEDGNVRMSTAKEVELSGAQSAEVVVREIVKAENKFQGELNRAFTALAEGSFKSLRRQLPVTRQRVEWEKIGGYRVSFIFPRDVVKHNRFRTAANFVRLAGSRHWRWKVKIKRRCSVITSIALT
nr:f-actin-capping protein subunit alpha [Quercus suber]